MKVNQFQTTPPFGSTQTEIEADMFFNPQALSCYALPFLNVANNCQLFIVRKLTFIVFPPKCKLTPISDLSSKKTIMDAD